MEVGDFFLVWKNVFSKFKYLIIAFIVAIVFYSLNALAASYSGLISFYKESGFIETLFLFFNFLVGFRSTTFTHVYVNIILLSLLLGILISLVAYKTKMLKEFSGETGAFATTGIFLGIIAPGCAACSVGILSLLGVSAASFTFLPYNGEELSFLATGIMFALVFKITKDVDEGIKCKVK